MSGHDVVMGNEGDNSGGDVGDWPGLLYYEPHVCNFKILQHCYNRLKKIK